MTEDDNKPQVTAEVFLKGLSDGSDRSDRSDPASHSCAVASRLITLERVIAALDMAAECPDWWKVNRLAFFCPEMTQRGIAEFLKIKTPTVKHYIKHVEIGENIYDNLPPIPERNKS